MVRHIALKPQYFVDCKKIEGKTRMVYYGDAWGQPANMTWRATKNRKTLNKGPYEWFHLYMRCKASNNVSGINDGINDPVLRVEPSTPKHCIENLEPGMSCQPTEECMRWIQNDETALSSDVGFYMKFQVSVRPIITF